MHMEELWRRTIFVWALLQTLYAPPQDWDVRGRAKGAASI